MPGVFRSMIAEEGKPKIGDASKMLGVRPGHDIPVTSAGIISPRMGGLSVVPEWRRLPLFLIPRRLRDEIEDARGSDRLACFRLSDIPFEELRINERLALRPDSPDHGTIEPSHEMSLREYQDALADTREMWIVDEA